MKDHKPAASSASGQAEPAALMDHLDPARYRFDEYLAGRGDNWWASDDLLQRWLVRSSPSDATLALVDQFGRNCATVYDSIAHVVEQRDNHPYIAEADPYNRGHRDVVLPAETWRVLGEVHGSGIWRASMDDRARYAIVYLLAQNGEFGVVCSMACTDGMNRALRRLGDDARSGEVIERLETATPESWIHGAQFVTEIQGGSDAATNQLAVEALPDGLVSLSGQKWFCSNLTADYWMVTGRLPDGPADHRGIGLFCVPRTWEGSPNGWVLQRLKDKLGTRALPTAEITFDGARGWPVGPVDGGLKNTVAIVLTTSRIYNTLAAAGGRRRGTREARAYASFRRTFGQRLADHPLIDASIERLERKADQAEAGALCVVDAWLDGLAHPDDLAKKLWARFLVSIAKAVSAREAVPDAYEAMMVLGGNGIDEEFCALPRLWRDAAIFETWEGSYTLLLMQALGDLAKFGVAGREEPFLRHGLGDHLSSEDVKALTTILQAPEERQNILDWGELAPRLYHCFERRALDQLA
jgi:alkylation response protein AidB-like acyl-CoA dehydrogenase